MYTSKHLIKIDKWCKNRQFLLCKWPQYHFSMVFMMVYISSCSLLVCQMNIYWDSTHIDVNWRQFDVKNDRKCAKLAIFVMLMARRPEYHFSMVFMMVYIDSCSLLVCQINIYWDSTHIDVNWRQFNVENDPKWSKIRKIVNFCCVNGHFTTFLWFLWWFISMFAVC